MFFGWFKKKKRTYVYLIIYYDFKTQKSYISTHFTKTKIKEKYPKIYEGIFRNIELMFVFEGEEYEE